MADQRTLKPKVKDMDYRQTKTTRYYVLTFDLADSAGRTNEYATIRRHIERKLGRDNVRRVLRQCLFVKADRFARDIRKLVQERLQRKDSVLVARLRLGRSYSITDGVKRQAAHEFFGQLREDTLKARAEKRAAARQHPSKQ